MDRATDLPVELPPTSESFPAMRRALREWGHAHGRVFPWRAERDAYRVFLAETLLQKTQVAKAEPAYRSLIARYPTIGALAGASLPDVETIFRPLGLTKRARLLRDAAAVVVHQFGGSMPSDRADLKRLPGVGDYTANAILCFAHDQALPIVDGAIARVLRRVFGLPSDKEAWEDPVVWRVAGEFLDRDHPAEHNYALLDLAAKVCAPREPLHDRCPLQSFCPLGRRSGL